MPTDNQSVERVKYFYVTFGQVHPLKNHVVGIQADCYDTARSAIFHLIGPKFAFLYDALDKKDGLLQAQEKYGLKVLWAVHATNDSYEGIYTRYMEPKLFIRGVRARIEKEGCAA